MQIRCLAIALAFNIELLSAYKGNNSCKYIYFLESWELGKWYDL